MSKIDFKKEWKELYRPSKKKFSLVEVPTLQFLMVDGHGDPNTAPEYTEAVEALYAVAYKIKFLSKKEGKDYVVPPLEGLWWAEDMTVFRSARDKSQWDWTMMIMTPEWVSEETYHAALEEVARKKNPPGLNKMRLEEYCEGLSVQILHLGSYEAEGPVLARMHDHFIPENGFKMNGKHHEIYLSDPRRTEPEKLKTILRQSVKKI
jgi:hypothetical protein